MLESDERIPCEKQRYWGEEVVSKDHILIAHLFYTYRQRDRQET